MIEIRSLFRFYPKEGYMNQIRSLSKILKISAFALAIALPVLEAFYWISSGYPFLEPLFQAQPLPQFSTLTLGWGDLTTMQRFLGFFSNLLGLFFSMASLFYLGRVFASMEKLKLFEKENARLVGQAGKALLWGVLLHPLFVACLSLSLTYRNPVGHRVISVAMGTQELEMLALGLTLLLISWILREAALMHEEQQATV